MAVGDAFDRARAVRVQVPLTPLVGREVDLKHALTKLALPEVRLLTLTGPAGVGKTHLALQVADDAWDTFADGVWVVPLAALDNHALVLPTIALAFGLADAGDRSAQDRLNDALRDRQALLVLDNFEHVTKAAAEVVALLRACRGLKLLVTSRAKLRVHGEHAVEVPSLSLPERGTAITAAGLRDFGATRLFLERASAAKNAGEPTDSEAEAIAEICRRLDGLPLAIELAAARSDVFPPVAMLARLDPGLPMLVGGPRDQPARLQTMRDAIAWSYDLLEDPAKALFRRLSVFAGGFTLEGAERLVHGRPAGAGYPLDAGVDPAEHWWLHQGRDLSDMTGRTVDTPALAPLEIDAAAGVEGLLGQSLIRRTAGPDSGVRFDLLQTIREFGQEQLAASGEEEATRAAHAAWVLLFVEIMNERMWNDMGRVYGDSIAAELANVRSVLDWAAEHGAAEAELQIRLLQVLWLFWQTRGLIGEGRERYERALALDAGPIWDRMYAAIPAGLFAWMQGDLDRADAWLTEALDFFRSVGNALATGQALNFLGLVAWTRGDFPRMVAQTEQALERYRACNGRVGIGTCLILLGIVASRAGQRDQARGMLEEAHRLTQEAGFAWGIATARLYAGEVERDQGNAPRAAALFEEAMDSYWAQGDPWGTAAAIAGLATLAVERREWARAARLLGAADALRLKAGAFLPTADPGALADLETLLRLKLKDGPFAAQITAGRTWTAEEAIADARRLARAVVEGGNAPPADDPASNAGLTPRERQVLRLIADGSSDRQIADALFIEERTAEFHVANVKNNLGLTRKEIIAAYANRSDFSEPSRGS